MTAMETVQNLMAQIGAERIIQKMTIPDLVEREDGYTNGELIEAATAYALGTPTLVTQTGPRTQVHHQIFPFPMDQWEPLADRREQLVKSVVYMLAAIEKLDREALAAKLQAEAAADPLPSFFTDIPPTSPPRTPGTGITGGRSNEAYSEPIALKPASDGASPLKGPTVYHFSKEDDDDEAQAGIIWQAAKKDSRPALAHTAIQYCRLQTKKVKRGMRKASMTLSTFAMGEMRAT